MEGIRYHTYACMLMGIYNALSWFCDMVGQGFHNLLTKLCLKVFVNNNAVDSKMGVVLTYRQMPKSSS